jgi:hypothetical protein
MRKFSLAVILFCVAASVFSIGFTFGPVANEQYLIENDGKFPLQFYDFPLFFGGIYHKIKFSDNAFYYVDLAFDIHKSRMSSYSSEINDMDNYLFYFHNDINYFPFKQNLVYAGAGIELIVLDRVFSDELAKSLDYNYYITTNYFFYIDCGINIPIGKIEIGLKTLYRLLPFSINSRVGNGEIALSIGLR